MISERLQRLKYVAGDYISSNVAIFLYNFLRYDIFHERMVEEMHFSTKLAFLSSSNVILGQIVFPIAMMAVFYLSGYYTSVFRKSRIQELVSTVKSAFVVSMVVFFTAMINDLVTERVSNYELILLVFGVVLVCVYITRGIITLRSQRKLHSGEWKFNTLIIGAGDKAVEFEKRLQGTSRIFGYNIVGMVNIMGEKVSSTVSQPLYEIDKLPDVCRENDIKELIVIPTNNDVKNILDTINNLFVLCLPIKISPDIYNILVSKVRLIDFHGEPLVDISDSNMTPGEANVKRVTDCVFSILFLILLSPLFLVLAIMIKRESPGSIFYRQERVGYRNKPFMILKFRTMRSDAESDGTPRLSSDNDERITKIGKFLRKYRIDELPQFWNVIKGDMSIVGPRPERQYYIDQITKKAPFYSLLHQVRPGITSMGMVKFGYARNVDEMIERMKYDLMYLENMSLLNDMKIMVYTIETVLTGKGI